MFKLGQGLEAEDDDGEKDNEDANDGDDAGSLGAFGILE